MNKTLYTIGYGNGTLASLLSRLAEHEIRNVIDCRAYPNSVARQEFAREPLRSAIRDYQPFGGMVYVSEQLSFGNRKRENPPFAGLRARIEGEDAGVFEYVKRAPSALMCACGKALDDKGNARCHRVVVADVLGDKLDMEIKHL